MPYNPLLIRPMREELLAAGVEELQTPEDVDSFMAEKEGTALLVFNSVCGCAAGMARPGIRMALDNGKRPDRVVSVFAGQDVEATAKARSYLPDIPPSSPSMAFFKDGELIWFMPRHRIEGRSADDVSRDLSAVFEEHCA